MHPRYLTTSLILLFFLTVFYFLCLRLTSQIHYQKAVNQIRREKYETAADHLEKAIHQQGSNSFIWKKLGETYHHMGLSASLQRRIAFSKKAEQAYQMSVRLNPLDAEAIYGLAIETEKLEFLDPFLNSGKDSKVYNALPLFQQAIDLRPNSIRYHYALARYLHKNKKKQELLQVVTHLTRIYPSIYRSFKKEAFWSPEVNEAAKKGMFLAIEDGITPSNTHMTLSSLLSEEKDWDGAISHYQAALTLQSVDESSGNYFHLGRLYLENRQFKKAEETFISALSISQNQENDLEQLFGAYKAKGNSEELYHFYLRASNSLTLPNKIYILLARSLIELKQYHKARQTLIDLNQKEPSSEAFYWLARIAEIEKDWNSMELAMQQATVLEPKNSNYYLIFSQLLKRLNKLKRAEKEAGLAIQHATKPSISLFNYRASIRWDLNDFLGAANDWKEAIRLNPNSAALHAQVAEASIQSGQWSQAVEYYEKAIRLNPKNAAYRKRYLALTGENKAE